MYQYMIAEKLYGMEVLLDSIPEEHWRQAGTFKKGHPQEEIRRMKIRSPVESSLIGFTKGMEESTIGLTYLFYHLANP